ncbi:Adenylate cyclase 1 [Posidoniimonas polymericola]|uniref:Adenylate cyclase 1 n=1 Tax=Posidoniimonas polymericola TaxID=2528002 RepID=A0A5C5YCS8_9BACT|nr:adenylate/guanylate cyclase domain-containing protein [Posidoniimonas polymericola]TWT72748.1 Adenylate cyclase 1 [Posidoniimonas polymericola]
MSFTLHGEPILSPRYTLRVFEAHQLVFEMDFDGPVELGRQRSGEARPYHRSHQGETTRVVIAPLAQTEVSRQHVRLELAMEGGLRCENISRSSSIIAPGGLTLPPGESQRVDLPLLLTLGDRVVRIEQERDDQQFEGLGAKTQAPGSDSAEPEKLRDLIEGAATGASDAQNLVAWLRGVMNVFQSAASQPDFLNQAVIAAASIADLDATSIVEWTGGDWRVTAGHVKEDSTVGWRPSRRMLDRVREGGMTFRSQPGAQLSETGVTRAEVAAIVAAPILNAQGEVVAALYGEKRRGNLPDGYVISELDAMLVELLASSVAAGLARLQQEKVAVAAQVQLEQFFTPELARTLAAQPGLLEAKDIEISVLFSDLCSFSSTTERAGAPTTLEWLHEVMSLLADCVLEEQGVLVDFQGDGMMAMWGAPAAQPDHAQRACQAAVNILQRLPELSAKWEAVIQCPTQVGIGINTGAARVGNIGSRQKFKYGALGSVVNIGARVQQATRRIGVDLLITEATARAAAGAFESRPLGHARLNNISQEIQLHELPAAPDQAWRESTAAYAESLSLCQGGDLHRAAASLTQALAARPHDQPTLMLLSRVIEAIRTGGAGFQHVWDLSRKPG